jgi:hypothetical protein
MLSCIRLLSKELHAMPIPSTATKNRAPDLDLKEVARTKVPCKVSKDGALTLTLRILEDEAHGVGTRARAVKLPPGWRQTAANKIMAEVRTFEVVAPTRPTKTTTATARPATASAPVPGKLVRKVILTDMQPADAAPPAFTDDGRPLVRKMIV